MTTPTEKLVDHLYQESKEKGAREILNKTYGEDNVWDTKQLQELYKVESFLAPLAVVIRRKDNQKGTVEFIHRPRFYFNFEEWKD